MFQSEGNFQTHYEKLKINSFLQCHLIMIICLQITFHLRYYVCVINFSDSKT